MKRRLCGDHDQVLRLSFVFLEIMVRPRRESEHPDLTSQTQPLRNMKMGLGEIGRNFKSMSK